MPQDPGSPQSAPQPVLTGPDAPPENVQRGIAFALIALPAGIIAWDLLWTFGVIASIVSFGVAWAALRLYRIGSGGPFSRTGAIAVLVITIGTLVIAYISGFAVGLIPSYLQVTHGTIADAIVDGRFWEQVVANIAAPSRTLQLVLAIVFGALGCARILVAAFRGTRTAPATTAPAGPPSAPRLMQDDDPKS
jgi:hypothetical protein